MATLLDASGMGTLLAPAFVFIFIFIAIFAVLKKIKILGDNDGINAILAFIVAAFSIMIPETSVLIGYFLPWFFMFSILVVVIFMFFMFLGVKGGTMTDIAKNSTFITFSVATIVVIFLIAMTQAFGPFLMVGGGTGFWAVTKRLIFSKRILGLLFMLFVAAYAVSFIGAKSE
jgi:hypothetical protein